MVQPSYGDDRFLDLRTTGLASVGRGDHWLWFVSSFFESADDRVVVGLIRVFADRMHLRGVIAVADASPPIAGTIHVRPVDEEVAEEDDVPRLGRYLDRFDEVRMILFRWQMGCGVLPGVVLERAVFMAARHDTEATALGRRVIEVE